MRLAATESSCVFVSVSSGAEPGVGSTSGYPKSHSQSFDKSGFATGTPPPFSLQGLASGSQAGGALGAPTAFVQYVPGLAAQPQAPMLAHQLHQVSATSSAPHHLLGVYTLIMATATCHVWS